MYSKNHKTVYERQGVVTNIASVPQGSPGRQSVACKIIKTAVAFAIAVLAATPASGQQTYGLRECVETGLRQNYSIRIVRGEEQITKNNAIPGNAGYLPSADLSGGYNGTLNDVRTRSAADGIVEKTGGVDNQTANAGLNINWTLFDGLGIQAEYARLKELRLMGELNTRLAVENLAADISAEYYNLIRQKTRLRNLRSTLGLSRERLAAIVEERYSIGSMSRLDLQQAQVDFNADSSKVLNQLEMVHTSRTRLNELMALENVEAPIAIKDSLIYPDSLLSRNLLWESTERNNVSLLMSRKNYDISSLDLKKARSRNYPYLKLNGGYGYTGNWYGSGNTEYQQRLGFNYGLTLGINVFERHEPPPRTAQRPHTDGQPLPGRTGDRTRASRGYEQPVDGIPQQPQPVEPRKGKPGCRPGKLRHSTRTIQTRRFGRHRTARSPKQSAGGRRTPFDSRILGQNM